MADDLIGKKIGGYEIIEMIGQGGMASVYRAHQVSMNRIVAVKVLPRQFLKDETYMQRFNREVNIVAKLEHRSIVPVHDYGEADGQPYIVMRFMAGGSVDDLIREGALDLEHMVSIIPPDCPGAGLRPYQRRAAPRFEAEQYPDGRQRRRVPDRFGIARLMSETGGSTATRRLRAWSAHPAT